MSYHQTHYALTNNPFSRLCEQNNPKNSQEQRRSFLCADWLNGLVRSSLAILGHMCHVSDVDL